jgi:ribosomal protein L18
MLSSQRVVSVATDSATNAVKYRDLARFLKRQDFIVLEDLFELPMMSSAFIAHLRREEVYGWKHFKMPVLPSQVEHSLSREFGTHIQTTPFSFYSPMKMKVSVYQANKLIQEKIFYNVRQKSLVMSNSNNKDLKKGTLEHANMSTQDEAKKMQQEITRESSQMMKEILMGGYSRYHSSKQLLKKAVPAAVFSSDASKTGHVGKVLSHAALILGKNASLHPSMKSDSLKMIHDIISK